MKKRRRRIYLTQAEYLKSAKLPLMETEGRNVLKRFVILHS